MFNKIAMLGFKGTLQPGRGEMGMLTLDGLVRMCEPVGHQLLGPAAGKVLGTDYSQYTRRESVCVQVALRGLTQLSQQQCPANGGPTGGLPTSANSEYPPCGGGLPECPKTKYCKKLDSKCTDFQNLGNCIGICVPHFDENRFGAKPAGGSSASPAPAPQPLPPQLAPSGPGLCPSAFQCPGPTVCVVDPRSGGQSFMCVAPVNICGGWRGDGCPPEKACVRDPRTNW
jgi:hypothetical protein